LQLVLQGQGTPRGGTQALDGCPNGLFASLVVSVGRQNQHPFGGTLSINLASTCCLLLAAMTIVKVLHQFDGGLKKYTSPQKYFEHSLNTEYKISSGNHMNQCA
jgi:hypothetical protein